MIPESLPMTKQDVGYQGSVIESIPHVGAILRGLLFVDLFGEFDVESPKVGQFTNCINLGLPNRLSLAQHSGSHHVIAMLSRARRKKIGSLQKDGRTILKGHVAPRLFGGKRTINGLHQCKEQAGQRVHVRVTYLYRLDEIAVRLRILTQGLLMHMADGLSCLVLCLDMDLAPR
jgi:hypothetical protein